MKKLVCVFALLILAACVPGYKGFYPNVDIANKEHAIEAFLSNPTSYIEGVWLFGTFFEVAIVKNTMGIPDYKYIGIVTRNINGLTKNGDIVFLINPGIEEGSYEVDFGDLGASFELVKDDYRTMRVLGIPPSHTNRLYPRHEKILE